MKGQTTMRRLLWLVLLAALVPARVSAQVLTSGTITASGSDCTVTTRCVALTDLRNNNSVGVYLNVGTSGTFHFEATIDGTNWFAVPDDVGAASSSIADGAFFFSNAGYRQFRVRASAIVGDAGVTMVRGFSGLRSTATLAGEAQGDGALLDGASASIKATVLDLGSGNPLLITCADPTTGAPEDCAGAGGGSITQYTEGDTDASITGNALMLEGAANTLVAAPGTAADGLLVNLGSNNDVTVTGSVTANAGTNLNTSALALESGGNLAAVATSLAALDNAVAGNELQVDVLTMPTTTVTATNLDVQIGGSDTLSVQSNALNLVPGLAEDGAHVSGEAGALVFGVRQDSQSDFGADGDRVPISIDADGAVRIAGAISCSNCTGSGASKVDDAAFTIATDSVAPAGFLFDDVTPDSVNEGDVGVGRMSANRVPYATLRDAAGNERGANVNSSNQLEVAVGNTVTVTASNLDIQSGGADLATEATVATIAGDTTDIETAVELIDNAAGTTPADNFSNPTGALTTFALMGCWDGSAWDRCVIGQDATHDSAALTTGPNIMAEFDDSTPDAVDEGDAGRLRISANRNLYSTIRDAAGNERGVNVNASNQLAIAGPVTNAGTFAVQVDGSLLTSSQLIDDTIFADEAAFTYATSKVQAFGAVAESTTDTLADGTVGAPVMTLSRFLRTTPSGYSAGGAVPVTMLSDNTNNDDETAICTGPCTVYSVVAFNHGAAAAFLRCENDTAGNTTPGSETAADGEFDFEIPGSTTGAGYVVPLPVGASFATALTCWIATGEAATDTTDAGENDVRVHFTRVQ